MNAEPAVHEFSRMGPTKKGFRTWRHITAMKLIVSLFLLRAAPSMVWACSCSPGLGCWSPSSESAACIGTAAKVHAAGDKLSVDFVVAEAFGKLRSKTALTVYTNAQSTACGYPFRLGVEYFVSVNVVESNLWTSSCSETRPAILAAALIRQMQAIDAGHPAARLFGFIGVEPYPGISPLSRFGSQAVRIHCRDCGRASWRISDNDRCRWFV